MNGFDLRKEFWKRRHKAVMSNPKFRTDYVRAIPKIMALCNINEIDNRTIQKIIWRMSIFHPDKFRKQEERRGPMAAWLKIFRGYRLSGVQNKSNASYAKSKMK